MKQDNQVAFITVPVDICVNIITSLTEEPSVSISMTGTQEVSYSTSQHAMMDEDHIPPEFFEEPESAVVEEGKTARFVCDVDGEPIPKGIVRSLVHGCWPVTY